MAIMKDFKVRMLYGLCLAFLALNLVLIIHDIYWFLALPLALVVLLLFFFRLDRLVLILVFLTPFSFKWGDQALGFTVSVPTEPIMVAIMVLFFLKLIYEGGYDRRLLRHPISWIILLQLLWIFITSITSEIPWVSFKFFLSRLWFVSVFFFISLQLFKNPANIRKYLWYFASALFLIILVITLKHSGYGFERQVGTWVVRPFFNDHTNYSAVIALMAPVFLLLAFEKSHSVLRRRMALLIVLVFCMGILFSYSRASWVSIAVAVGAYGILKLKIPFRLIVASLVLLAGSLFLFQDEIRIRLEGNTQDSSEDLREHVQSISNISSDASNLERINRWRAALRLFQERPLTGWGPGTYQMVYAPFQLSEDMTIITTNFGDWGNAHSEYLGPLAESGLPGMLLFIALALFALRTGVKVYKTHQDKVSRRLVLGVTLGLITYFVHGLLNNFLDSDKASVPFWGFLAVLVALDVYRHDPPDVEVSAPLEATEKPEF